MSRTAENRIIRESEETCSGVLRVASDLWKVLEANSDNNNQRYFDGSNYKEVAKATQELLQKIDSLESNNDKIAVSSSVPGWMQPPSTVSKLQMKELEESELNHQSPFNVAAQAA